MNTSYNFLDLTAKGRDENPEHSQNWVRYHDQNQCTEYVASLAALHVVLTR